MSVKQFSEYNSDYVITGKAMRLTVIVSGIAHWPDKDLPGVQLLCGLEDVYEVLVTEEGLQTLKEDHRVVQSSIYEKIK